MAQRELTPADYLAMLRRHWILILVCTLVGGPLAYGVSRVLPVKYKSQTLVLVEQQSVPTDYVKSIDTADISQRLGCRIELRCQSCQKIQVRLFFVRKRVNVLALKRC